MQTMQKLIASDLNQAELSAVLYYADFLSLKHRSFPVTDTCKYFFIHDTPINISFIVGNSPVYDLNDMFIQQSAAEYKMLKDKFGDPGVQSFINNICNLSASGSVNAVQMLKCIHQYSTKEQRNEAFKKYKNYKSGIKYTMPIKDDNGDEIEIECSKYVAHVNVARGCEKTRIHTGVK